MYLILNLYTKIKMNVCCLFSLKYWIKPDGKQDFHLMINVRVLAFVFSSWHEQNGLSSVLGKKREKGSISEEEPTLILCMEFVGSNPFLGDKGLEVLSTIFAVKAKTFYWVIIYGVFLIKSIPDPRNLLRQALVDITISLWNISVWGKLFFEGKFFFFFFSSTTSSEP